MKLSLAIEWFLNPDHLPFIVGIQHGIFSKYGFDFQLIEPDQHYDGLDELKQGNIQFATNEPLHLIEQFDENVLSLGKFFETKGGVLLKASSYEKLLNNETITVTTPVSNPTTDTIGFEIIRRYYAKKGVEVQPHQVEFVPNGFEHLKYMQEGADAGWLYFYNFEGIEAKHEGLEVLYLDDITVGFANFSALNLFVNKAFYHHNSAQCDLFVLAVKEAITYIQHFQDEAIAYYYSYTESEKSPLMDDILHATIRCFNPHFESNYFQELPILEFFRDINISNLENERFKTAFLR